MSDDAAKPEGPVRLVYAWDGSEMRLVEVVDERGRKTRYSYDEAGGAVTAWAPDGSTSEYAVPPERMLAWARHPETGAWLHVELPRPPAAGGPETPAWPTLLPGTTAEGATHARLVGGSSALPLRPLCGAVVTTVTYDACALNVPGRSAQATTYTYDPDGPVTGPADPS